jgi:hypothetical protein
LWTSETIFQALIFFRIPLERWNAFFFAGIAGVKPGTAKKH